MTDTIQGNYSACRSTITEVKHLPMLRRKTNEEGSREQSNWCVISSRKDLSVTLGRALHVRGIINMSLIMQGRRVFGDR